MQTPKMMVALGLVAFAIGLAPSAGYSKEVIIIDAKKKPGTDEAAIEATKQAKQVVELMKTNKYLVLALGADMCSSCKRFKNFGAKAVAEDFPNVQIVYFNFYSFQEEQRVRTDKTEGFDLAQTLNARLSTERFKNVKQWNDNQKQQGKETKTDDGEPIYPFYYLFLPPAGAGPERKVLVFEKGWRDVTADSLLDELRAAIKEAQKETQQAFIYSPR